VVCDQLLFIFLFEYTAGTVFSEEKTCSNQLLHVSKEMSETTDFGLVALFHVTKTKPTSLSPSTSIQVWCAVGDSS
jgi:hypothetical protein